MSDDPSILFARAGNRALGGHASERSDIAHLLADDEDCSVAACLGHPHAVAGVAGNPVTPPDLLIPLASHADPGVRWELARNPSLPAVAADVLLEALAGS